MLIAWWNPFAAIGEAILNFFIGVLLFLDSIVYSLISWVYQIILVLCQIDVLNNTFEIDALINRIYTIIGVVVLFLLAYSLLKSMVNPDDALKGKKSPATIIKDVIISIVLIALIPTVFDFAMGFQTAILENNTIGKIILGSTTVTERDENGNAIVEENSTDIIRNGGITIASNVLRAFLHPNYSNCTVDETSDTGYDCSNIMIEQSAYGVSGSKSFDDFWKDTVDKGSIGAITDLSNNIVDGGVTYYYIISTIAGVCVLIVLLSYCFDVALRLIKLAVYQLIAPLPILSRIMPGEQGSKVFSNWLKATISTYVEVFIRLAILFFAVLLIKIVVQNFTTIFAPFVSGSDSWTVILFAQLFVIIGIILFIKQAPGMIKDITGLDSSKFGVFKNMKNAAALIGGGIAGRSLAAGWRAMSETDKSGNLKSIGNQYKRWKAKEDAKEYGATFKNRTQDKFRKMIGMPSLQESYDTKLSKNTNPLTNKQFEATYQSGQDIELAGNVTIKAGDTIKLDANNVQLLNEKKALNEQRKAEIAEAVRQYKGANDSNKQYANYEDEMKKIATKEIGKGKYFVRDANGNLLSLEYTDSQGNIVTSGNLHKQTELEAWLEGARDQMSADDYGRLSDILKTAITKHTVDSFIQNNGADSIAGVGENVDLLLQKNAMATTLANNGGLLEIDESGKVVKFTSDKALSGEIDKLVSALKDGTKQASDLSREEISMLSDLGNKTLNSQISHQVQLQEQAKAKFDEENAQIDRLIAQGKEAADVFKASSAYKASEASSKSINTEDRGK